MAGGAAAGGAAIGIGSALGEIIGEVGDLLEAILNNMDKVVLYEDQREFTKLIHKNGKVVRIEKHTKPIRITMLHAAFMYAALRIAGVIPAWGGQGPWWEGLWNPTQADWGPTGWSWTLLGKD